MYPSKQKNTFFPEQQVYIGTLVATETSFRGYLLFLMNRMIYPGNQDFDRIFSVSQKLQFFNAALEIKIT
jgi:hypothetical protein